MTSTNHQPYIFSGSYHNMTGYLETSYSATPTTTPIEKIKEVEVPTTVTPYPFLAQDITILIIFLVTILTAAFLIRNEKFMKIISSEKAFKFFHIVKWVFIIGFLSALLYTIIYNPDACNGEWEILFIKRTDNICYY